ncbi:hypothetical protein SGLAM104S_10084 [Streptomyces glaucescens]
MVRDETDDLARAVDAMADALQQRLEAERRVTADIAHELRTQVTGLLTAAELLPPGRPTELVLDRAKAMRTLVEDVLEGGAALAAQEGDRVYRRAVVRRGADLEVQVRAAGVAGVAGQGDLLAGGDDLADLHVDRGQVGVLGVLPVAVLDDDGVAVRPDRRRRRCRRP